MNLKCKATKIVFIFKYLPFLAINEMYEYLQENWKIENLGEKMIKKWIYVMYLALPAFWVVSSIMYIFQKVEFIS